MRNFIYIISIVCVFAIFGYCSGDERQSAISESSYDSFVFDLADQDREGRVWHSIDVNSIASIGEEILFKPGYVKGTTNDFFVIDYGDLKIKKFGIKGELIATYGLGRGEGPGEFFNPTGIAIDESGMIWVPDGAARTLSWFASDGGFIRRITFDEGVLRVAPLNGGGYYLMRISPANPNLFHKYDRKDSLIISFGKLVKNHQELLISLNGDIVVDRGDLIFVSSNYGVILRFSEDGNIVYAVKGMEKIEMPRVETSEVGESVVQRVVNRKTIYNCPSIKNDKLYIHAHSLSKETGASVLDVFSVKNGKYEYSLKLPDFFMCVSVAGNYIYALRDTTAVVYRMRDVD